MNILIILTGGTIGSAVENGYINTNGESCSALLKLYTAYDSSPVHFDCVSPYTILSENMNGRYLHLLAQCISEHLQPVPRHANGQGEDDGQENHRYDGIIVTHGTDTLQYTAAGLYHLFSDVDIPIVLVSSNYILEDARANGFANFSAAVSFIKQQLGTGVFVSYQNNSIGGDLAPIYIYQGNMLLPYTIYSDALYSLHNKYYCRILPKMNGEHITYDTCEMPEHNSPLLIPSTYHPNDLKLSTNSGILMLYVAPGMYFPEPVQDMKAILLVTYHSGTLPTADASFLHFARKANAFHIPIYVVGAAMDTHCTGKEGSDIDGAHSSITSVPYESTAIYDELHLHLLPVMSPVDAYMQLLLS